MQTCLLRSPQTVQRQSRPTEAFAGSPSSPAAAIPNASCQWSWRIRGQLENADGRANPRLSRPTQPNPTCQPKTLRIDQAVEHRGIRRIDRNGNGVGLRLLFTTLPHLSAKSKKPQFTPGSDALRQGVRRIDFRFTGCQCSVSGLSARVNSPAGNSTVPSVTTRYF